MSAPNSLSKKGLPPVIALMGPTATGKSLFAIELGQHLPIEIISVDSAMVYQGMDIGTSKPTLSERAGIPHHLIDIRDPKDTYSAAEFANDAKPLIEAITRRQRVPVLVGGTMLYFKALETGLSDLPAKDLVIRESLLKKAETEGWPAMHHWLATVDPKSAERIHQNDAQRIERALEVYLITGEPLSHQFRGREGLKDYAWHAFSFAVEDRALLHQKVSARFDEMLKAGFVAEVERLFYRGDLQAEMPSMRAVGYRQIWGYLQGAYTADVMREKAIAATRQLAKRQITWLRSLDNVQCLSNNGLASVRTVIESAL